MGMLSPEASACTHVQKLKEIPQVFQRFGIPERSIGKNLQHNSGGCHGD